MKYRLLNYLACPYCKDRGFPLKLIVIEVRNYPDRKIPEGVEKPLCDLYCAYLGKYVKDVGGQCPCDECIKIEVATGVLICPVCGRWYPIIDEIPRLLPDEYRDKKEDLEFLRTYSDKIPDEVKYRGKPFNLSEG